VVRHVDDRRSLFHEPDSGGAEEPVEVSALDQHKFRFMIDEISNFTMHIMGAMVRRIRGMSKVI
jgi:hypothetical protein